MSKQKPPPAPDYAAAATAQGAANVSSANATAGLNRPNQIDPNGTQTWAMRPGADPNNPQAGDWTVTNSLNSTQQALKDQQDKLSSQYGDLAANSLNNVGNTMNTRFNSGLAGPQSVNADGLRDLSYAPNAQPGRYMEGPQRGGMLNGPGQAAFATTYGQEERMGAAEGQQRMTQAAPMGQMTNTGEAGQMAPDVPQNRAQLSTEGLTGFGSVEGSSEQSRQRVTDALYQRQLANLNPRTQQDTSDLTSRLAAQGITEGSAAYNRAVDNQKRQQNDAYAAASNDAIAAGGAEESRIIRDNLGTAQFQNATRGQEFGERGSVAGFNNANLDTTFGQGMAAAGFNNDVRRDAFDRQMDSTFANNATVNGQYDRETNRMGFNNQASSTDFNQGMARVGMNRDAQRTEMDYDRAGTAIANDRFDNNFQQGMQVQGFNNDVMNSDFDRRQSNTNFNNSVDRDNFNVGMAQMTANNAARGQGINERTGMAGFNNNVRGNTYAELLAERQLPMNEANALRTGAQVSPYQFQQYGGAGTVQPAPIYDATRDSYNAQVGNVNAANATTAGQWQGAVQVGQAVATAY